MCDVSDGVCKCWNWTRKWKSSLIYDASIQAKHMYLAQIGIPNPSRGAIQNGRSKKIQTWRVIFRVCKVPSADPYALTVIIQTLGWSRSLPTVGIFLLPLFMDKSLHSICWLARWLQYWKSTKVKKHKRDPTRWRVFHTRYWGARCHLSPISSTHLFLWRW